MTILTPANTSNFTSGVQAFNLSVRDNVTQVQTVILMFNTNNTAFNVTLTNVSTWNANVNMATLNEGPHTVRVYANDTVSNVNTTQTLSFTVDRTAPTVDITSPSAGAIISGVYSFNATVRDNVTQVTTVIFQFSNGTVPFNRTASNTSGTWSVSLDTGILSEGGQTIIVFANDTVGNMNNAVSRIFDAENIATPSGGSTAAPATTTTTTTAPPAAAPTEAAPAPSPAEAAPAAAESATAGEVSSAFQRGDLAVSVSTKPEAAPRAAPGVSAEAPSLTGVETKVIKLVNNLDKRVVLSAALEEEEAPLENEEILKRKIKEGLLLDGEASDADIEEELEALRLLGQVEILQAYKTKLSSLLPKRLVGAAVVTPLTPTKKHISARLLKDLLINAEELQNVELNPGQELTKEIKLRRGLTLDKTRSSKLIFSSGGEEVFVEDLGPREELLIGIAVDADAQAKKFDFYIVIPPQEGREEDIFTVELDINVKKPLMKPLSLPLKAMLPLLFTERSKTIYGELYGPYKVNLRKGALLAVQYDASALEGEYEIVGRVYENGDRLVAENKYEVSG